MIKGGGRLEDVEAIKWAVTTELRDIQEESFQQCIAAWQRRTEKCIRLVGGYFDYINENMVFGDII